MPQIKHFLLVFDHARAELIDQREFGTDSKAGVAAYNDAETLYRDRADVDIVLVGSDSLETVKLTHANYFSGAASVSRLEAHLRQMLEESMSRRSSPATMVSRGGQSAAG